MLLLFPMKVAVFGIFKLWYFEMATFKCYSAGKMVRKVVVSPGDTWETSDLRMAIERTGVAIDRGFTIYRTKKASGFFQSDVVQTVFVWRGDYSLEG